MVQHLLKWYLPYLFYSIFLSPKIGVEYKSSSFPATLPVVYNICNYEQQITPYPCQV